MRHLGGWGLGAGDWKGVEIWVGIVIYMGRVRVDRAGWMRRNQKLDGREAKKVGRDG
jgi:hypothetical protein